MSTAPTREQMLRRIQVCAPNPVRDRLAGLLGDLELNRLSRLLLHHHRAGCHPVALRDISYSQFEKIAGPKLTVDGEIEQRQVAMLLIDLSVNPYRPNLLKFQRRPSVCG